MKAPPVIVFPMHGCEGVGMLNEKQSLAKMARLREAVRREWQSAGVKALVELIEQRTARAQRAAVEPGAGPHEAGQAYGLQELLGVLHAVVLTQEESPGG